MNDSKENNSFQKFLQETRSKLDEYDALNAKTVSELKDQSNLNIHLTTLQNIHMNERVQEIAVQAGLVRLLSSDPKAFQKFAELIVKECVGLAKLANLSNTPVDIIKEHFGVE